MLSRAVAGLGPQVRAGVLCAGVLGLWLGAARAAPAGGGAAAGQPSEGTLATREGKRVIEVPLKHTEVTIRVSGHLADVQVVQTFQNPFSRKIEAVYLFPLPTGAAVNAMQIRSGKLTIEGQIHPRAEAARVYRAARDRGQVAALLTQERPNLFTQSVANLEPGAEIDVTLRYVQALTYDDGEYEVVFPMVAGPRYVPPPKQTATPVPAPDPGAAAPAQVGAPAVLPPGMRSGHDIGLSIDLDAGVPITGVTSPSHAVVPARAPLGPSHASLRIAQSDSVPNKDFVLRYRVAGARPAFAVIPHRSSADDGAFFLMAQPPAATADADVTPRELVFLIDTSSSMAGAPLDKARQLVRRALAGMRASDTFQIVRFDDAASALGPRLLANRGKNVEYATAWLDALRAGGGTEVATGIDAALALPHDPARLRIVVFLTDGFVGNEDTILAAAERKMGDARLFSFGVGSATNRYLLEELARIGRGTAQVVRADEDEKAAVERFHQRIARPLLTDLRVDWHGLTVRDVSPARLPDLFAGQPLILSGHYGNAGSATVTVHARQAGRAVEFDVPVTLPERADRPAVATVWARARIAELSRAELRGERAELKDEIVKLALAHRLMTRYTAFVAVDSSRVTAGGPATRVDVPVEVPDGVRRTGTGTGGGGGGYGTGVVTGYGSGGGGSVSGGISGASYSMSLKPAPAAQDEISALINPGGAMAKKYKAPSPAPPEPRPLADPASALPQYEAARGDAPARAASATPTSTPAKVGESAQVPPPSITAGSIDREALKVALRKLDVRSCVDAARKRRPDLAGKLTLEMRLTPSGADSVHAILSSGSDSALDACLLTRARAAKLSAPSVIKIRFPMVLGAAK